MFDLEMAEISQTFNETQDISQNQGVLEEVFLN